MNWKIHGKHSQKKESLDCNVDCACATTTMKHSQKKVSLSVLMTALVTGLVLFSLIVAVVVFLRLYQKTMEENAVTGSEQSVVQVQNTVSDYVDDMRSVMAMIKEHAKKEESVKNDFFKNLLAIRSDLVSITTYDTNGSLVGFW